MNKRIAIYLRVSTDQQSTDLQRHEIEHYLKTRGWSSVAIYSDKLSGTTAKRPGLQKMLSDARSKSFDVLIIWKLDRLFRSLKDLITTLNELTELKVDFISLKDNIDLTTASGRLLAHLLGAIGQFEADLIKMRVVAGLAEARRKGIRLGRPTEISIEEVKNFISQGLSPARIAAILKVSKSGVYKTLAKSARMSNLDSFHNTNDLGNADISPPQNQSGHELSISDLSRDLSISKKKS